MIRAPLPCLTTNQSLASTSEKTTRTQSWHVQHHPPSAIVAASQLSTPPLPSLPTFTGPYSLLVFDERISEYTTSLRESLSDLRLKKGPGHWEGTDHHQWSSHWGDKSCESQNQSPMSPISATTGAELSSSHNGAFSYPSNGTPKLPPIISGPGAPSPRLFEHDRASTCEGSTFSVSRPDSAAYPAHEMEQSQLRPLKMHNILNPSSTASDTNRQQALSLAETASTSSASSSRFPTDSSPASSNRASTPGTTLPPLNMYSAPVGQQNPLLLNPSVLGNRGLSPRRISVPNATIDAKISPFLSGNSQVYKHPASSALQSGTGGAHGNTSPATARPSYGFSVHQMNTPDRRANELHPQAPPSQSNSPSTSYSSYSQPSHASPALQFSTPAAQPLTSRFYGSGGTNGGGTPGSAQITLGSDSSYGPATSAAGQSTYQLMTLDTDQGPIQVPVDVQAASKMADEKRKRNAGASARFRQRRKEKEKESSQTIAKLESQIREIGEERDYYRAERDYFRGLVYNSPTQKLVVPRLPSPRLRKPSITSSTGSRSDPQWEQVEERGLQTGRNTRRRISGAYTPTYELPPPALGQPSQTPVYNPPAFPFPKPEPRADTPGSRLPLPQAHPRAASFGPTGPPAYEQSWSTNR